MRSFLLPALALLLARGDCQGNFYDPEIQIDESRHDIEFFKFVTRPDIDAPKWDITVYDESAVAPGLWFVAPYGSVNQTHNSHGYVAPHIYDGNGELVWSGSEMFQRFNTFSFKMSRVDNKDMLSLLYPHTNEGRIIDNTYQPYAAVHTGRDGFGHNMHEFQVVDQGKRALFIVGSGGRSHANADKLGVDDRRCRLVYQGIEERDIATDAVTFAWSAQDLIDPDESYMWEEDVKELCEESDHNNSDYMHLNSLEKLENGDYLVSSRRTYTIFRVTKEGKIAWRLGGKKSDFTVPPGVHWSGQHDLRCLEQNETHLVVSFLDNALVSGAFPPSTNPESRGMVLSINEEDMTADLVAKYDHPTHEYAESRGSFQTLPNGNALIFWTSDALNSEYTADGQLIKVARFLSGLKTYRGYKYPWEGHPTDPPDVHSQLLTLNNRATTVVHVSWNGATEVSKWNLYRTDSKGKDRHILLTTKPTGFETALLYPGHAEYVVVQGLDRAGKVLGESDVFYTVQNPTDDDIDLTDSTERVQDLEALAAMSPQFGGNGATDGSHPGQVISAFVAGILFTCAAAASFWFSRRMWSRYRERRKRQMYSALQNGDDEGEEEEGEAFFDHHPDGKKSYSLDEIGSKDDKDSLA